jgi:hypothetical protein
MEGKNALFACANASFALTAHPIPRSPSTMASETTENAVTQMLNECPRCDFVRYQWFPLTSLRQIAHSGRWQGTAAIAVDSHLTWILQSGAGKSSLISYAFGVDKEVRCVIIAGFAKY